MYQIQIEPGVIWRRHLDQIASNSTHFNCQKEDNKIIKIKYVQVVFIYMKLHVHILRFVVVGYVELRLIIK